MEEIALAEVLIAFTDICVLLIASILIGYQILKKRGKEREIFFRYHAEEAMRIKAKHYQNRD